MDEETLRKAAIEQYSQGKAPHLICLGLGRTKPWFFKWLRRYRTGETEWYRSRHKTPHNHPHKIPPEVQKLVKKIRIQLEENPRARIGSLAIKVELKRIGVTPPSDWTIYRILKRGGLIKKNSYSPESAILDRFSFSEETIRFPKKTYSPPIGWKGYKSLSSLIKDYRQCRQMSQDRLAGSIGISVRELQRWETNSSSARIENLHDLSEVTGIPMEICIALNADRPVWYSLEKRLFAYSLIEVEQFVNNELRETMKKHYDEINIKVDRIETDNHISQILLYHRDTYGENQPLQKDLIKRAAMMFPDLSYIALDPWGHLIGYLVFLPLKLDVYQQFKKQRVFKSSLTGERISDIVALHGGVFFGYSLYAANASVRYLSLIHVMKFLAKIEQKERYIVAAYPATREVGESCEIVGMKKLSAYKGGVGHTRGEILPALYEIRLDALVRRFNHLRGLDSD